MKDDDPQPDPDAQEEMTEVTNFFIDQTIHNLSSLNRKMKLIFVGENCEEVYFEEGDQRQIEKDRSDARAFLVAADA